MSTTADDLLHRPEREANVRIVRVTAFFACMSLGAYSAMAAAGGMARPGIWTGVLWAAAGLAALMGLVWLVTDKLLDDVPVYGFVIASDVGIAVALASLADPRLTLLASGLFVIVGSFAGYHASAGVFVCHVVLVVGYVLWAATRLPLRAELVIEVSTLLWLVLGLPLVARALWSSERRRADRAFRDPLTDVANRAGLERAYPRLRASAALDRHDMCVLAVDLDRFKAINDTFGHAAGDEVIVDAARHLREHLGPGALIARTGGEEFTVVLTGPAAELTRTVDAVPPNIPGPAGQTVTMSIGAVWAPVAEASMGLSDVTTAADDAMYEAKRAGGDRLCTRL